MGLLGESIFREAPHPLGEPFPISPLSRSRGLNRSRQRRRLKIPSLVDNTGIPGPLKLIQELSVELVPGRRIGGIFCNIAHLMRILAEVV